MDILDDQQFFFFKSELIF